MAREPQFRKPETPPMKLLDAGLFGGEETAVLESPLKLFDLPTPPGDGEFSDAPYNGVAAIVADGECEVRARWYTTREMRRPEMKWRKTGFWALADQRQIRVPFTPTYWRGSSE